MSGAGAGAFHLEEEVEELTVTNQRFLEASVGRPSPSPCLTHQTRVPGRRVPGSVLGAGHPAMTVFQELTAWGPDP